MKTSLRQTEADFPLMDTHIHLDSYPLSDQQKILADMQHGEVRSIISVSMHLASCKRNLEAGPAIRANGAACLWLSPRTSSSFLRRNERAAGVDG